MKSNAGPWPDALGRLSYLRHGLAIIALLLLFTPSTTAQSFTGFDEFLRRYEIAGRDEQQALARSFVAWQQERGGFPIADTSGQVTFVYFGTGDEREVRLTGDFRAVSVFNPNWDEEGEQMSRVGSIFHLRKTFESDARLDYRLVVDGKAVLDPLNQRSLFSGAGGGGASELVMPAHRLPPELVARADVQKGTLQELEEPWAAPKVTVYLPPGYNSTRDYPTVYTADGSAWVRFVGLPAILDNLIADRAIEPVIAVLIDAAPDRSTWYHFNEDYLAYLRRVVDYVDGRYATRRRADARLHAGTSAGGKATAFVGFELPSLFGKLAMLSSSLSGPLYYFEPYFSGQKRPDPALQVWMSAGTYEGSIHAEAKTLEAYFRRAGIATTALYQHQGHSFGTWRESAVQMLKHFFPTTSSQ